MWPFSSFYLERSPDRPHSLGDGVRPQFTKPGTETPAPRYTALSHPALNQPCTPTQQRGQGPARCQRTQGLSAEEGDHGTKARHQEKVLPG